MTLAYFTAYITCTALQTSKSSWFPLIAVYVKRFVLPVGVPTSCAMSVINNRYTNCNVELE